MSETPLRRRTVLAAAATGIGALLAGCSGGNTEAATETQTPTDADTTAPPETTSGSSGGSADLDQWFSNTSNYDGIVDKTGQGEVTVKVGASGNGGNFAFGPAAVRVDPGTTVVWEWTGKGSMHNVAAADGAFASEMTDEEGHTFSRTFESAGTVKYACTPHESMGMKGAVVVE